MSLTKRTTRRLPLLAGASLAAALGAALAPSAAFAQTATCTSGTAVTGNGTAAVTIAAGNPNNPGITCNYTGDTATVTTLGAITVSTVANIPLNGVNLTASGTDDINWTSTAGTITGGNQTNGPVISALSEAGNITLNTGAVTGSAATVTHGVFAQSTGGGNINLTFTGSISATNSTTGQAAIEAVSSGGNGNVSVIGASLPPGFFNASGRLFGIRAGASGAGTLTINGAVLASSNGGVAVDATTGTGLLSFTGSGIVGSNFTNGIGVRLNAGGDVLFNGAGVALPNNSFALPNTTGTGVQIAAGGNIDFTGYARGGAYGLDLTLASGKTATINITAEGAMRFNTPDVFGNTAPIRAQGAGSLIVNVVSGVMRGGLDLSGLTTAPVINVADGAAWTINNSTMVSSVTGATVNVAEGGTLHLGITDNGHTSETISVGFSGAHDVFNVDGTLSVHAVRFDGPSGSVTQNSSITSFEGQTTLIGLEQFNNNGLVAMGTTYQNSGQRLGRETDLAADDILSMPGTRYVGNDGRLVLDVNLNAGATTNCSAANRDANGDMPADCLSIVDGSTEGTTYVTIRDQFRGDRGAYNPGGIVLVDVSGSGAGGAQGDFLLAEDSDGYTAANGGIIDKGAFAYLIAYDAEAQQHKLVGLPSGNSLQMALLPSITHSLWRTSTGTWLDRQADMRSDVHEGIGGGVWLRASTEFVNRDAVQFVTGGGQTFGFDNTLRQNTYAVTGGFDVLAGAGGDTAYVLGVMAGYSHADVEYEANPNKARLDGASLGGYASLISGGLFVDAAVNVNRLDLEQDVPAYDLFPAGTLVSSKLMQTGVELQAGWRFPFSNGVLVEPLAGVSYVQSKYDDVNLVSDDPARPGVDASFDDPTSLRASLGGRVALEQNYGSLRAQYSLLGRVWNEFDGETIVTLHNIGPDAVMVDDFSGQFNEFGVGASLSGLGGLVSGFFNFGGKFGDDYRSQNLSAGVRVNW